MWRLATGALFFQTCFFSLGPAVLKQFVTPEAMKDLMEVFWWTPIVGSGLGLLGLVLARLRAACTTGRLIYLPAQRRVRISGHTLLGSEYWTEVPLNDLFVQTLDESNPVHKQSYFVKVAVAPGKYRTMELERSSSYWGPEEVQKHLFGAVIGKKAEQAEAPAKK